MESGSRKAKGADTLDIPTAGPRVRAKPRGTETTNRTQLLPPEQALRVKAGSLPPAVHSNLVKKLRQMSATNPVARGLYQALWQDATKAKTGRVKQPVLVRVPVQEDPGSEKRYVSGLRRAAGSFAKFRLMIDASDPQGQVFGVREHRLQALREEKFLSRPRNAASEPKTTKQIALQRELTSARKTLDKDTQKLDLAEEKGWIQGSELRDRRAVLSERGRRLAERQKTLVARFEKPEPVTAESDLHALRDEARLLHDIGSDLKIQREVRVGGRVYLLVKPYLGDLESVAGHRSTGHQQRRALSRELLVSGARQLQAVHARGIFHRDVKPENFLYDADGRIELADWTDARTNTSAHPVAGTPAYNAPETLTQDTIVPTASADLFALGVSVAEVATGKTLFPSTSRVGLLELFAAPTNTALLDISLTRAKAPQLSGEASDLLAVFEGWHARDPALAHFVVNELLHPDSSRRASAAKARTVGLSLQPEGGQGHAVALGHLHQVGEVARRQIDDEVAVMRAYADAYNSPASESGIT